MITAEVNFTGESLAALSQALKSFIGSNGDIIAPYTKKAFSDAGRSVQKAWQNWAMGGSLAGAADIKSASPKLAQSIKVEKKGDFDIAVYTDSSEMTRIQEGRNAQDMKLTYPFGKKSRISKDRIPYLIIPFRWGTPTKSGIKRAHFGNAITPEVYKIVKAFHASKTTRKTHQTENAGGELVDRAEYNWEDRFINEDAGNMNGMVKMANTSGGSTYFTFRVISMNSKPESWWKKAIPPNDIVGALAHNMESQINDMIQAALEVDLDL